MAVTTPFATIEEAIEEIREGRMVVVVDDEDRENEGDLVVAAAFATDEAVNFMATHARGLICLCLTGERCEELGLPQMTQRNEARLGTAFTVSVEAREGVTTGISAADRAHTIAALGEDWVEVSLIPETLERTTLGEAEPGRRLNVECDVVAKYVERLVAPFERKEQE